MSNRDAFNNRLAEARDAARSLAQATTVQKNAALESIAKTIEENIPEIVEANQKDLTAGKEGGLGEALLDRLMLDEDRLMSLAAAVREVIALPDPVGEVVRGSTLANGIRLQQVRVPFGVVGA